MKTKVNPHIKGVLCLSLTAAFGICTLTAQLVNDGATNTLSNVTNTFTGDVTVGTNGSFTLLILSDNALLTNSANGVVGRNATANSNEVRLVSATARWQMGGSLIVGHNGAFNQLLVSNGATVLSASSSTIGNDAFGGSPNSNSVTISGAGSLWNSGQDLIVGELGFANRLEVNNGGWVVNSNAFVGRSFFSPSNMVVVTGAGSVWSNRADLNVGGTGAGNLLIVSNGGWVVNNNASIGASSLGNLALVTGTNSVWSNRTDLFVGNGARGNRLVVSDGGRVVNNNGVLGFNAFSSNNLALVTGSGSLWSNLTGFILGRQGPGNLVVVSNGGILKTSSSIQLGQQASSSNNTVIVTGVGSRWDSMFDSIVFGAGGGGNRLLITNGGAVLSGQNSIGLLSSSINNEVLVTDAGSRWVQIGISVGQSGSGNRLVITNGGSVFGTAYINVGENPSSTNNRVVVDGGSLRVTNVASTGVLDVRRGTIVLNDGIIDVDYLTLTNATQGFLDFKAGTLVTRSLALSPDANNFTVSGTGNKPTIWDARAGVSNYNLLNAKVMIGSNSSLNQLLITNGAVLRSRSAEIGSVSGGHSNVATLAGVGSLWHQTGLGGKTTVGGEGSFNQLLISKAATFQSGSLSYIGESAGANFNVVALSDSGSLWFSATDIYVGYQGSFNQLIITNGAVVANFPKIIYVGVSSEANSNTIFVSGSGSQLETGRLYVGWQGSSNRLVVENGAKVNITQDLAVGSALNYTNASNRVEVNLGGTLFVGNSAFTGASSNSTGAQLVVNGGALYATNASNTGNLNLLGGTNALNAGGIEADHLIATNARGVFELNGGTLKLGNARYDNTRLFKVGDGTRTATLQLAGGTNEFVNGLSIANQATLTGFGTIANLLTVESGGTLSPGDGIGRLICQDAVVLQGATLLEISKIGASRTNDQLQIASILIYAGSLVVTNLGPTELTVGDNFKLFPAAAYLGSFGALTLPPLAPGLGWTNKLSVDGSIEVIGVPSPKFTGINVSGTNIVLSGTNGTAGVNYAVLTATNVVLPASNWLSLVTNQFGTGGQFSFTNSLNPNEPQRYFRLRTP